MELGRSESNATNEADRMRPFTILHAWSDLREEDVALSETGISRADLMEQALLAVLPLTGIRNILHWNERHPGGR